MAHREEKYTTPSKPPTYGSHRRKIEALVRNELLDIRLKSKMDAINRRVDILDEWECRSGIKDGWLYWRNKMTERSRGLWLESSCT